MTNRILLTGAGFSANFGAPLASEISDLIFRDSHIQNNPNLRGLLQKNFDYEHIYRLVMQSDTYIQNDKNIFNTAVQNVYIALDDRITNNPPVHTLYEVFRKLICFFAKPYGGSGFIFTLNQDLLIERRFHYSTDSQLSSIEIPIMGSTVLSNHEWGEKLSEKNKRILPEGDSFLTAQQEYENRLSKNGIQLSYIKLHGSQEWFKNDSNHMMVLGGGNDKSKQIETEPLLNLYFEVFKRQLSIPNTKLLVIGYGFNDEHINKAISEIDNLELFIIDTQTREAFTAGLNTKPHGHKIGNLIRGYFTHTLLSLFPNDPNNNPHPDWEQIKKMLSS